MSSTGCPVPAQPAHHLGGDQVFRRHRNPLRQFGQTGAGGLQSDGGLGLAPGPARRRRRPVRRLLRLRWLGGAGAGERIQPHLRAAALPVPTENRQLGQLLDGVRVDGGGVDDRGVGQDPPRRDVSAAGDVIARLPQFPHRRQRPRVAHLVNARRATPSIPPRRRGLEGAHVLEFLCCPIGFALLQQDVGDRVAQLEQHLDIQRGIVQPVVRQRTLRPVRRAVSLHQLQTQQPLHHRGQVDPVIAGQPACQFGVVQLRRLDADLGQAGQVLIGRVQHPLVGGQHLGDRGQRRHRVAAVVHRVDQHCARTLAADLHEIGAIGVPEAGRPLGIDRERPVAGRQKLCGPGDFSSADRQLRHPVPRCQQWRRLRLRRLGGLLGVRHRQARVRELRSVTPAGGRPAACSSTSQNACTCGPSSSVVAVHDARSSSWWARGGPEMSP